MSGLTINVRSHRIGTGHLSSLNFGLSHTLGIGRVPSTLLALSLLFLYLYLWSGVYPSLRTVPIAIVGYTDATA